jgi:hypothetical protein
MSYPLVRDLATSGIPRRGDLLGVGVQPPSVLQVEGQPGDGLGRRPPRRCRSIAGVGAGADRGPAVHDDLVRREFTAAHPNGLWLADITEHPTGEEAVRDDG